VTPDRDDASQLALPLGSLGDPSRRRLRPTVAEPPAPPAAEAEPFQTVLPFGPGLAADTPPFCRCCQTRGCLPVAGGGWTTCTWCEGSRVDPVAVVTWLSHRQPRPGLTVLERLAS
jgi:hypothetical protein